MKNKEKYDIILLEGSGTMSKYIIIGAGASGMVAAINLKRNNNDVTILEKNDKCGKKLLATGNGRCNYYNNNQDLSHYYSDNKELIEHVINKKTNKLVLNFFDSIGIVPRIKNDYYYPYSNTALSIENTLVKECIRLGVNIKLNEEVTDIEKNNNKFEIKTKEKNYQADKVVISTGSSASLKEEIGMYDILKKLGHKIVDIYPALTRLNLDEPYLKEWSGIRNDVTIKLLVNDEVVKEEVGEILYTNNGLSGICTFGVSNYAAKALKDKKQVEVVINNMKDFCDNRNDFINLMDKRDRLLKNRNISELLDSYINYKLVNILIKRSGLNCNYHWNKLDERSKNILASSFVDLRLKVIGTDGINKSQTISGGVPLSEINLETMESKVIEGLYLTGEMVDINGDCGGYNLTIAWTTALLTGGYNA